MQAFAEKGIVALGQGIKKNGELAIHSRKVVEKVAELVEKDTYSFILFVGGSTPRSGFVPARSEAEGMQEEFYKITNMPNVTVLLETKSKETLSNACFSRRIIEDIGIKEIDLVAPEHHIYRAAKLFRIAYGTTYKINKQPAQDVLTKEEKSKMWYAERASLECTLYIIDEAKLSFGNYKQIIAHMMRDSPIFNKNATVDPVVQKMMEHVTELRRGINKYSSNPD